MKNKEVKKLMKKLKITLAIIMASSLAVPAPYGVYAAEENSAMEEGENVTAGETQNDSEATNEAVEEDGQLTDTAQESGDNQESGAVEDTDNGQEADSQKPGESQGAEDAAQPEEDQEPEADAQPEEGQKPEEGEKSGYYLEGNRVINGETGEAYKGTGFILIDDQYYYVVNGIWNKELRDVVKVTNVDGAKGKWWYVKNGKADFTADTVAQNSNGWWYIEDGCVNFDYDGFAENSNGWWYCRSGEVDFQINGVIKGEVNGENGWWYVEDSQVKFIDTVARNSNGWWCIENGKVNFNCNSVEENSNGWWKIRDGKVDFKYNGLAENGNGCWLIRNGKVDFSARDVVSGTVNGKYGWWYVEGGKVTYKTTVAENSNGWWYIEKGKVNFECNSIVQNQNGWWKIRDGKVDFGFTGIAQNQNGWWYCKGGKVQFETTTVVNGTVDGETAWWYVEKGKVNKSYNGLGSNSNGTWLVENGRVDFSFSGKKTINGVEYTFKEGRCMNNYRGWKKLGGKYYYFDRNTGAQMKNCTVDGIRLNSDGSAVSSAYNNEKIRTMIKARSIMESITNKSDSKETKLRKCFDWVMKHPYKRYRTLKVARQKAGWEMLFANDHFERGQGCCVADACAFAFLAHECGYGTVYICDGGSHAWVEINGYLYDPMMAEEAGYDKYYHSNYKKANFSITSDQVNRKKI